MNKLYYKAFSAFSVIRVLSFIAIFILDDLWEKSIPDTGAFSNLTIDFEFSFWEKLFMYIVPVVFIGNSIIWLILTFRSSWLYIGLFKNKLLLRIFYWAELISLPVLIYLAYEKIGDEFFPDTDYGYVGQFLSIVFPPDRNTAADLYKELQVINFCLLTLCCLIFVSFFWKFYRQHKINRTV
jgi:hypothetical protein